MYLGEREGEGQSARGNCGRTPARGRVSMRGEGVDLSDTSSEEKPRESSSLIPLNESTIILSILTCREFHFNHAKHYLVFSRAHTNRTG